MKSLRKWIVGATVFVLIVLLTIPGLFSSTAYPNCWNGAVSLRTLVSAQEDFRSSDRDRNGIRDYWRRDVAGLYTFAPPNREPLKLIELSVAQADRRPASPVPGGSGEHHCYWFETLRFRDEKTPDPTRFAFCAIPDGHLPNDWTLIVDHHGVVYGKRIQPYGPLEFYPVDPPGEGWITFEKIQRRRGYFWWLRFWDL